MAKTWFITGAGRGLGAAIAEAALASGDNVVATARSPAAVEKRLGRERVLALALDVTREDQVAAAIEAAISHFGTIDVVVNNAGYGQLGPFEENSAADAERQFATNVTGVFNVCRAVLPVLRRQRSGHVFNLSSIAGVMAMGGSALYCASKFAVEGFSEALAQEVAPFGIRVTLVEPGVFRTDFLDDSSAAFGNQGIADYAELSDRLRAVCAAKNHQQTGDPAKLGAALLHLVQAEKPPLRYLAGSDAHEMATAKLTRMLEEFEQWKALSRSTDGVA
jgi:NAD(P)-dependent dehydrogenase (short-subunit alcohol dehydrogenase family)